MIGDPGAPSLFPEPAGVPATEHTTGLLPSQSIEAMVTAGHVLSHSPVTAEQIQPASLDMRVGAVAYRVRASFMPGRRSSVMAKVRELLMQEIDLRESSVLERGCVYIIPLQEELRLPSGVSGKANAKSTTGRLDVFTRLITDFGGEFDRVPSGYRGRLFVEVVPRTFSIRLRDGARLNQVRFTRGEPLSSDARLEALHAAHTLVYSGADEPEEAVISHGLWISVDLRGTGEAGVIGYRAKEHAPVVDLAAVGAYEPEDFWELLRYQAGKPLILNPGDFYILASSQKVRVPPTHAAEMVAYDPAVGEYRIHYAGFFDPGFGYGANDIRGTRAVLEVRSYEVPSVLEEGQVIGRIVYERLLSTPSKVYGASIGSSYQGQGLALSKQFRTP